MPDRHELEKWTDAFFDAVSRGDLPEAQRRIHPEARAMQNVAGEEVGGRELLDGLRPLLDLLSGFAYENPRRVVGDDAVVEQHDVRLTRKDGREVVLDVCIVLRFDAEGLIVRIDEYLDATPMKAFLAP